MQEFYTLITKVGGAIIANATMLGHKVNVTDFAVGDGAGSYYTPIAEMTELKREVWRGKPTSVEIDPQNANMMVVSTVIPAEVGGFTIREMALFTEDGKMIAISNCPELQKVTLGTGVASELALTMQIAVSNAETIEFKVDPTVILATKSDVEKAKDELEDKLKIEYIYDGSILEFCKKKAKSFKFIAYNGEGAFSLPDAPSIHTESIGNIWYGEFLLLWPMYKKAKNSPSGIHVVLKMRNLLGEDYVRTGWVPNENEYGEIDKIIWDNWIQTNGCSFVFNKNVHDLVNGKYYMIGGRNLPNTLQNAYIEVFKNGYVEEILCRNGSNAYIKQRRPYADWGEWKQITGDIQDKMKLDISTLDTRLDVLDEKILKTNDSIVSNTNSLKWSIDELKKSVANGKNSIGNVVGGNQDSTFQVLANNAQHIKNERDYFASQIPVLNNQLMNMTNDRNNWMNIANSRYFKESREVTGAVIKVDLRTSPRPIILIGLLNESRGGFVHYGILNVMNSNDYFLISIFMNGKKSSYTVVRNGDKDKGLWLHYDDYAPSVDARCSLTENILTLNFQGGAWQCFDYYDNPYWKKLYYFYYK